MLRRHRESLGDITPSTGHYAAFYSSLEGHRTGGKALDTAYWSVEKKTFLMESYDIPEDHIFSSRDTTFEQNPLDQTKSRGVDVILNSLAGETLSLSWRKCLAPLGRFVEIGKRDAATNNTLEMEKFLESVTFAAVDLGIVATLKPPVFNKTLKHVMNLHQIGALVPVSPITAYPISELQKAMRLMQSGKHTGKVVIPSGGGNMVQVSININFPYNRFLYNR